MIDRSQFVPDGSNPPCAVPVSDLCTVPTQEMAELMADLVLNGKTDLDILEIGTGSGYQAAILAERCRSVVSIDVVRQLGLPEKLPSNVFLLNANGYEYDTHEQFDGVLVTFEATRISPVWVAQLRPRGRLVVPLVCAGGGSRLSVYMRVGTGMRLLDVAGYASFTAGAEA